MLQLTVRPLSLFRVVIRGGVPNYDKKGGFHPVIEVYQVRCVILWSA